MFSERFYNHYRDDYGRAAREAMNALWLLIGINILCFFLSDFGHAFAVNPYTGACANPALARLLLWSDRSGFRLWQIVSYMFFHGDFTHILFNMYGLYLFGSLIAPILGRTRFLILYFASGALFGVMVGVAMLRPNQEFFLFFVPVPIKAKTMMVVYALLEIVSEWRGLGVGIAHLAHLGGFLGGYLYLRLFCKRDVVWSLADLFRTRGPRLYRGNGGSGGAARETAPRPEPEAPHGPITRVSQKEVDRLLDKISRDGINSLTEYERAELQFFREQMRGAGR